MSIAIDVDKVVAVLLADGWHEVAPNSKGKSSFGLDAYEYIERHPDQDLVKKGLKDDQVLHGGGQSGICATGAYWKDKDGFEIACPLTSVLAVKVRKD